MSAFIAGRKTIHPAKTWQIILFSLNNGATNLYLGLMTVVSFYATGILGVGVVFIGVFISSMRFWDAITDPILAIFIDKTNGRLGKFRPFIIIGNISMALCVLVIYRVTYLLPQMARFPVFAMIYVIYIVFYTFQTTITKAAQSTLTKDPKQRPLFSLFNAIVTLFVFFIFNNLYTSNYLVKKYGGFENVDLFGEYTLMVIAISAIFSICAIIGIWERDRSEFFDTPKNKKEKIKLSVYWNIIKKNRPLQMLIVMACSDKLAVQIYNDTVTSVIIYGILAVNYGFLGQLSMITVIPSIILAIVGTQLVRKFGVRYVVTLTSLVCIVMGVMQVFMIGSADMTKLSFTTLNGLAITWIVTQVIRGGSGVYCSSLVYPMIADCTDYEVYRSGHFVPGMISNIFSLVDKVISSFASTIVALCVAAIGYTSGLPQIGDAPTTALKVIGIVLFCGFPILGWVLNLIAMKFYILNSEKMREIQSVLVEKKLKEAADL
jgi:Na+/melibiose symporter-like transporter